MSRLFKIPRQRWRGIFLLLLPTLVWAGPYRPADDAEMLERVPRARPLPAPPTELAPALVAARNYIEQARTDGDPRWLGYAEGALQAWWQQPAPPSAVRVLRATLHQARHRFAEAEADLVAIRDDDPLFAQAQITLATLWRVQGRYAEAAGACARLIGRTDDFVVSLCEVSLRGLSGDLQSALKDFETLAAHAQTRPPALRGWHAAEWAEALLRAGDAAAAEQIYRGVIAGEAADPGLRAAYADLLLETGRPAQALSLAQAWPDDDRLALRALLAQQALGTADAALRARVAAGFAAARARGEPTHLREEALFTLRILDDPKRALEIATRNWQEQREPADTLLLVQAAQAAGRPQALTALREWLLQTDYGDARLQLPAEPQS